jgi:hypothetical protein
MDTQEWEDTLDFWEQSASRHVKGVVLLEQVREDICLDCDLSYQVEQMLKGNCFPKNPEKTPYARNGMPDEEEE